LIGTSVGVHRISTKSIGLIRCDLDYRSLEGPERPLDAKPIVNPPLTIASSSTRTGTVRRVGDCEERLVSEEPDDY
jgi:hypothetical protein